MIRVSAIIPVYNGVATVARAIESTLAQQFEGFEVVVVDDGSTDATPAMLANYGSRIRVVRQRKSGPAAARNHGARIAAGEYLAFLDADDEWLAGKLGRMVAALDGAPGAVLAYSKYTPVDRSGRELKEMFFSADNDHAPSMDEMLSRWVWPILTSAVVMRRETFARCGGFSEEFTSPSYEDPHLWLRAREQGEFVYVPEPLVRYRTEPALERIEKYAPSFKIFARLVRQRYGDQGQRLIAEIIKVKVAALNDAGLSAIVRSDGRRARRAFMTALRYQPRDLRSFTRLLRSFLPPAVSRRLTGRVRSQARQDH
jgi:glycosyltransferase involved in cell wall biosynthesis